jgi:hypothetical protein
MGRTKRHVDADVSGAAARISSRAVFSFLHASGAGSATARRAAVIVVLPGKRRSSGR